MQSLKNSAFMCLIGCWLSVTLSMTVLTGGWAIAGSIVAVILGILSGGLYAAYPKQR